MENLEIRRWTKAGDKLRRIDSLPGDRRSKQDAGKSALGEG